jgi:hypothetical protein
MLENFFFLQGIKVLRHRTLFDKKDLRPPRTIKGYGQLLSSDDVHLKKHVYASIAQRLLEKVKSDIGYKEHFSFRCLAPDCGSISFRVQTTRKEEGSLNPILCLILSVFCA